VIGEESATCEHGPPTRCTHYRVPVCTIKVLWSNYIRTQAIIVIRDHARNRALLSFEVAHARTPYSGEPLTATKKGLVPVLPVSPMLVQTISSCRSVPDTACITSAEANLSGDQARRVSTLSYPDYHISSHIVTMVVTKHSLNTEPTRSMSDLLLSLSVESNSQPLFVFSNCSTKAVLVCTPTHVGDGLYSVAGSLEIFSRAVQAHADLELHHQGFKTLVNSGPTVRCFPLRGSYGLVLLQVADDSTTKLSWHST
jgi:hypothetical protein